MGSNNDTAKFTWYGGDIRVTPDTLDLFGVGIHWEHLVPVLPELFEDGVGRNICMPRYAGNSEAVLLKEPCN
jgi:hypothetical protein